MACYRNGGCGPYEYLPCNECPASKPEYAKKYTHEIKKVLDEQSPIKIKAFLNEDGVMCVLTDSDRPIEIEFIDAVAVENDMRDCGEEFTDDNNPVDAYINQLCCDGFTYVADDNISVTNMLYSNNE
jgi:hypothetical protein